MNIHLSTHKSVIISSPAGSGKTEKLSRRYIALLQGGVEVERILAITFTDKAAAEMKQRILRILRDEDMPLFRSLLDKMPLMRVSTIHSFCGTLLRRFSFEASIDPDYRIADAIDASMTWEGILHDVLMDAGKGSRGHDLFIQSLSEKGFRGLDYLKETITALFRKSPFSLEAEAFIHRASTESLSEELASWQGPGEVIPGYNDFFRDGSFRETSTLEKYFLTDRKEPRKRAHPGLKHMHDFRDWAIKMHRFWTERMISRHAQRTARIADIYRSCLKRYGEIKSAKGTLDFSDLEYSAYKMLTENPQWANILYAFDEKTDHILVDEFQDTNTFQWGIINKLTEEWRSGLGAKRDGGKQPTVFFVGDEKQSVYFFRGANVEIFRQAKQQLADWLDEEFRYEEAKENYRSLPAIIEFTNRIFSKIMAAENDSPPWITKYSPFSARRSDTDDPGQVELILLDKEAGTIEQAKEHEAEILAQRIQSLEGTFPVTDRQSRQRRPCTYLDMAVLLRKRTHLKKYEDALRRHNIPFVTVKGIGYYQEAEVAMLRALVYFLSNPSDDYSLYVLLKSPLFHMSEQDIVRIMNSRGDCLFSKLQNCSHRASGPEQRHGQPVRWGEAAALLAEWRSALPFTPLADLIEQALLRTKAWKHFYEPQRKANIKKFLKITEDLEAQGKSILKIRDFLERTCSRDDEPKANVNTEGMNAVKIMTIHAAKGLEFPLLFLPGLDEPFALRSEENLVYEKEGRFFFKSLPEPAIRRQDEDFMVHEARQQEEQKRLFYVAVTRAGEGLFLISHWSERDKSFLSFLRTGLDLEQDPSGTPAGPDMPGLSLLKERDVLSLFKQAPRRGHSEAPPPPVKTLPLKFSERSPWNRVTEAAKIKKRHGKDWLLVGDLIHRILEGISTGVVPEEEVMKKARNMLAAGGMNEEWISEKRAFMEDTFSRLKEKGLWQSIIMPREHAFTELPFVYEEGGLVFTGRIDRIVMADSTYRIYDYKTFPFKESERDSLLDEYSFQLNMYKKAVMSIFKTRKVKSYIIFTHTGDVQEI